MRGSVDLRFLDAEGEPGELSAAHRAYGREGKPCYPVQTLIGERLWLGEAAIFCPRCQRAAPRFGGDTPLA